jgi:hypothetical protein
MNKTLTFGFKEEDLRTVRTRLEFLLKIHFEQRDSSFYGGTYFRWEDREAGQLILQNNFDRIEQGWIEEAHQDFATLLNVSGITNEEMIKTILAQIEDCRLIRETQLVTQKPDPKK